jgi:hypothetical protein
MADPKSFPVALGKLLGGATYATISIPLDANLKSLAMPDGMPEASYGFNEIEVQAATTNTGLVYVTILLSGQSAGTVADLTAYTNVIAIIPAGATWSRYANPAYSNKWNPGSYYLTFANSTDFAIGNAGRT